MPELPEVETIKRQLSDLIIGKNLGKEKIIDVARKGKMIFLLFDNGKRLVFHLKMTGQLIFNQPPSRFTRKVFRFNDGSTLLFNDARKFGWYKMVGKGQVIAQEKNLGPDSLTMKLADFQKLFSQKRKTKIKPLLMEQKFIAGIGNIYADEILFSAGVSPLRTADSLSCQEIKMIFQQTLRIFKKAIDKGGSSVEHYLTAKGEKGTYTLLHKVYQKTGKPCFKCGNSIKRIKLAGRGTHFCAQCQR